MFVVFWQESDLSHFPETSASSLASLMGIDWAPVEETTTASSSSPGKYIPSHDVIYETSLTLARK